MSCQTSKRVPILSIYKICEEVMTFCLNVLPEALPAGQGLRSAIIKGRQEKLVDVCCLMAGDAPSDCDTCSSRSARWPEIQSAATENETVNTTFPLSSHKT